MVEPERDIYRYIDELFENHKAMVSFVDVKDDTKQLLAYQKLLLE